MSERTVLISGAGIAGPTLAYWLSRHGLRPTVVEYARDLRSSGSPVDVRGPALPVVEAMGITDRLRAAATGLTGLTFIDGRGRRVGRIGIGPRGRAGKGDVELPRSDLARILYEAGRDDVEYFFGDTITALAQDPGGVDVTFERAAPRRFDLVIGADGLHSRVRRLAFGAEAVYIRHLGLHVATMPFDEPFDMGVDARHEAYMYNEPGRSVTVHPAGGAAFIYRAPAVPGLDRHDLTEHKRLVTEAYADAGWRTPELLERLHTSDDLYFDTVSQVRVPHWHSGRVALLGDAASCASLLGEGSSLAITGAHTLATTLADALPGTAPYGAGETAALTTALRDYQSIHNPRVSSRQRGVRLGAALLVPATRPAITLRNLATRLTPAGRTRTAATPREPAG